VVGGYGCNWWWLRSPGNNPNNAAYVNNDGNVNVNGNNVDNESGGVRPAFLCVRCRMQAHPACTEDERNRIPSCGKRPIRLLQPQPRSGSLKRAAQDLPGDESQRKTNAGSTPGIDVSVTNSNIFAAASSNEARDATIDQSTGVTVTGDNSFDYKTSLSLNNSMGELITVAGTGNASASILHSGSDIQVADGTGGASLAVYGADYVPESYQIPAGFTTAVVSGSASNLSVVCPHQYGAKHRSGTHWERTCALCGQTENAAFSFWDWILFIFCFGWIWM